MTNSLIPFQSYFFWWMPGQAFCSVSNSLVVSTLKLMLRDKFITVLLEEDKIESDYEEDKHHLLRQCVRLCNSLIPVSSLARNSLRVLLSHSPINTQ